MRVGRIDRLTLEVFPRLHALLYGCQSRSVIAYFRIWRDSDRILQGGRPRRPRKPGDGTGGLRIIGGWALEAYKTELDHDGRDYPISIADFAVARCEKGGAILLDDAANRKLSEILRSAVGLLQPAEIREAREELGLTQKELANCVQIAEATISRWETGAQIQQRSMNKILRGFYAVAEFRRFLGATDDSPITLPDQSGMVAASLRGTWRPRFPRYLTRDSQGIDVGSFFHRPVVLPVKANGDQEEDEVSEGCASV